MGGLKLCTILMTCINIWHIDYYCIKGLNCSFLAIIDFNFFSMMGLLICKLTHVIEYSPNFSDCL